VRCSVRGGGGGGGGGGNEMMWVLGASGCEMSSGVRSLGVGGGGAFALPLGSTMIGVGYLGDTKIPQIDKRP
jgi:hypothetical protein